MNFERTMRLRITDWPRFNRTTTFELDEALFLTERSLREHVHSRYGDGMLHKVAEGEWEFRRRIPGPRLWWSALSKLLNKSYA
jgi:hypothetical protein